MTCVDRDSSHCRLLPRPDGQVLVCPWSWFDFGALHFGKALAIGVESLDEVDTLEFTTTMAGTAVVAPDFLGCLFLFSSMGIFP